MKTLALFLTSFLTFLMPIKALILTVILFTILDTITGIYVSIKLEGRKSFRSGKLWNIVPKTFMYSISIILSFMIDKFVFGGMLLGIGFLLSKSLSILFIYIEIISINENSMKLGNRSFFELIKGLLSRMKSIKKDINKLYE